LESYFLQAALAVDTITGRRAPVDRERIRWSANL